MFVLRNLCRCKARVDKHTYRIISKFYSRIFMDVKRVWRYIGVVVVGVLNLLKPTGYVMHQQFNIQQL